LSEPGPFFAQLDMLASAHGLATRKVLQSVGQLSVVRLQGKACDTTSNTKLVLNPAPPSIQVATQNTSARVAAAAVVTPLGFL
jgi:hypothetical protein